MPAAEVVSVLDAPVMGDGSTRRPWLVCNGATAPSATRWRGVRLANVARRRARISEEILFNGADVPIGTMPDFQRSIPLSLLDANTLLAFEMNGQPLPVEHGFPRGSSCQGGPAIRGSSG